MRKLNQRLRKTLSQFNLQQSTKTQNFIYKLILLHCEGNIREQFSAAVLFLHIIFLSRLPFAYIRVVSPETLPLFYFIFSRQMRYANNRQGKGRLYRLRLAPCSFFIPELQRRCVRCPDVTTHFFYLDIETQVLPAAWGAAIHDISRYVYLKWVKHDMIGKRRHGDDVLAFESRTGISSVISDSFNGITFPPTSNNRAERQQPRYYQKKKNEIQQKSVCAILSQDKNKKQRITQYLSQISPTVHVKLFFAVSLVDPETASEIRKYLARNVTRCNYGKNCDMEMSILLFFI